jgi:uncharacterized protein
VRVVLDTNVLLAAFATRGLCEAVFTVCLSDHELILSEAILAEVGRNLTRKLKMPALQAAENVALLREQAWIVEPAEVPPDACRDLDDCAVLGTAQAGAADVLVTGDNDLLVLKRFHGVRILSPRAFHDLLR